MPFSVIRVARRDLPSACQRKEWSGCPRWSSGSIRTRRHTRQWPWTNTNTRLAQLRVRAWAVQAEQLLDWARQWPQHSWAIENASGLGYLLAQQLAGAGEHDVDAQPKLAARSGCWPPQRARRTIRTTPARSRSWRCATGLPLVGSDDHAAVMKAWIRRRRFPTADRVGPTPAPHTAPAAGAPFQAGMSRSPGGQTGNDSDSSVTGSHPTTGSSDRPLPDSTAA